VSGGSGPRQPWISAGAVTCALAVVAGAFGAHTLASRLDAAQLHLWETASRYLLAGGFGVTLIGLAARQRISPRLGLAAAVLLAGAWVFSGTVAALALGAPRWLGAVTPLGGLAMIAGFLVFAWAAYRP
jgi:uncharacterized membrane protein YgdD (TMEM256/DUF423 family)